jgi:hypothetical protein
MTSQSDIVIDPVAPDDDLDGESDAVVIQYVFPKPSGPELLTRVRGNRCISAEWNSYQRQLLADGRYTFEELHPVMELCLFEAWDQAHEQDRLFEAATLATDHSGRGG